ncbi:MAG TPA: hypothetical protein VHO72_14495 [Bacteroidales bacterium]|nr:hypothetical protein [Bacteroidales bacterium]
MKKQIFASSKNRLWIISVLLFLLMMGCSEEKLTTDESVSVKGSKDWLPPYYFNWEDPGLNWMPYPSGNGIAAIPLPWNGQGSLSSTVDPDVLNDRKASDGWVLLYSTFSPTTLTYNPYFILYNKYRGLMRVFMYVNHTSFGSSSYLKNAITQPTNQYSILNFEGAEVIDVSTKKTKVTKIEPAPIDGSAPFASFKWYMLQYELAYDPNIIASTTANPPQLSFNINSVNISQVNLGGTATGTLKGTIGATGPTDIFSNITGLIQPLGKGFLGAIGTASLSKYKTSENSNSLGLNNDIFKASLSGMSGLVSTAASSIPGAAYNILSAIVGGNSGGGGQTVSLNLEANISLSGSITENTSLPSTPASFYFPGSMLADAQGNYNVQGFVPIYHNKPLGLFNLSNTPTINSTYTLQNLGNGQYFHIYEYGVNENSFSIQWNPALLEVANIENLTKEVIVKCIVSDMKTDLYYRTGTRDETIQGRPALTGQDMDILYLRNYTFAPMSLNDQEVLLRISFVVRPKNGAPPVAIVKTFKANNNKVYKEWL